MLTSGQHLFYICIRYCAKRSSNKEPLPPPRRNWPDRFIPFLNIWISSAPIPPGVNPLSTTAFPRTPPARTLQGQQTITNHPRTKRSLPPSSKEGRGGLEHTRRGVPPSSPEDAQGPPAVGVPWERARIDTWLSVIWAPGPFVRYQLMTAHMARRRYRRSPPHLPDVRPWPLHAPCWQVGTH
ncbi:hypothetical protein CDAR_250981 [Caerostris darwini]|uniref:Uncharacterized protein n=1 Tax=Caerostris darwini TaxID=1538125 RepID=A0AAV4TRQ7_9ARAC|nr:hypothetical protein CDAR_250981 [Caerostris darwini]